MMSSLCSAVFTCLSLAQPLGSVGLHLPVGRRSRCRPSDRSSQPEHVEHGRVALLLEFRRVDEPRLRATGLGPDTIATYCLPLTSKVIGGAEKPEPTLIFHSSSSVVSSKAATVPSSSARNTRPPPVASVPRVIRIAQVHVLLDLAGQRIDGGEVALVAVVGLELSRRSSRAPCCACRGRS